MRRLILLCLLLGTPAMAQTSPSPQPGDPRLQSIPYDAGKVVRLNVATNFQLTVIFNPTERVENVAIGNSDAWQATVNRRGDTLFLKPVRQDGATNMTVITDARIYNFELTSSYGPTADTPYTVRFLYDETPSEVPAGPLPQPGVGQYRLRGPAALRPLAVTDDGVRTYIQWRPEQVLPAVFAIDARGDPVLVDGHVRDGRYVIDAVYRTLVFRLERQTARALRVPVRNRR
ncbi:MAG: TrbG/VirB9 family P-type conjugative transfer protein [Brevundimonas sp.]|uniref:TrbG/VirB9 family P-type conjugative transfer protein n=1 Tax=Brevundimonas sp. TaxID=1871086 RepID=UPI0026173A2F|nr:TrbG/VirB9 family P-type conjugative transfer protein [Brevundimonas sp.]MDI6623268.1 TrbG/VirB9 family P-type conjugative transfer protein [Brevundimonas sp.]MDQ7812459.1 TrbG/VirB9 family P-type conjugative transfer protein [Brevundimonas sp.]